jgi:hypothetical protein
MGQALHWGRGASRETPDMAPSSPTSTTSPVTLPAQMVLTAPQRRTLRAVAALIIPADAALGMPGADDARIALDIESSIGRDAQAVQQALARLDALAGGVFADLPLRSKSRQPPACVKANRHSRRCLRRSRPRPITAMTA